jgi:ABC-2 type transport system permease protein
VTPAAAVVVAPPSWPFRLRCLARSTRLFYTQALAVELTYRFSLVQGFVGTAVNCIGLILFWMAAGRGATGAYDRVGLLLYFLYASAHSIVQESRVSWNLATSIRMGKLAASLLRPCPFLVSVVCQAASFATVRVAILALIFAGLLGASETLRGAALAVPADVWRVYVLALVLSLAIGWLTRIGIGLLAFDMTQTWGPELIFLSFYVAASGLTYPPDLLPPGFHAVVTWTPVYYMIGFPSLILLGHLAGPVLVTELQHRGIVLAVTAFVVWAMWRRGMKKFEAVGI